MANVWTVDGLMRLFPNSKNEFEAWLLSSSFCFVAVDDESLLLFSSDLAVGLAKQNKSALFY